MKMNCGVYLNGFGFKVGRKYLSLVKAYSGSVVKKMELDSSVIAELEKIKESYSARDVRRTQEVLGLFDGGSYTEIEEEEE